MNWKVLLKTALLWVFLFNPCFAQEGPGGYTPRSVYDVSDGTSVNCYPYEVQVSSGSLTCSKGVASITTGGVASSITGLISPGTNITLSGNGTIATPYVINSSGGGSGTNYWLQGTNAVGVSTTYPNGGVGIGTTFTNNGALVVMSGNVGIGTWGPTFPLQVTNGNIGIGTYKVCDTDGTCTTNFSVYPPSGIPNSTGTAWGTSYTTTGSGTVVALQTTPTLASPVLQGNVGIGSAIISGNGLLVNNGIQATTIGIGTFNLSGNGTTTGIFNSGTIGVGTLNASGTITTLITASTPVVTNGSSQLVAATNLKDLAYCQSNGTNCPAAGANYWLQGANNVGVSTVVPGGVGIGTINTGNGAMAILGNVGIGTWGAQANLDVEGAGTIKAAGQITANNYNSTGSTIPANGWTESAANQITFATNSLQNMVINSSGNLGIGTINAATSVKIGTGTTLTGTVGNSGNIQENGGSLTSGNLTKSDANQNIVDAGVNFGTLTNGDYCTYASSGTQISCTSSGGSGSNYWGLTNVGIFTGEPSNVQNVGIGTSVGGTTHFIVGNVGIGTNGSSLFILNSTATPPNGGMVIEGNVGIGTYATPNFKLSVMGTGASVGIGTEINANTSGLIVMTGNVGIGTWIPAGGLQVGNGTNICSSGSNCFGGNMGIGTTSPTSSIEVEGGNVGIGTTQTAPYPLFVNGNVGIGSVFLIGQGTASPTHLCIASGGRAIFTCL